MDSKFKYLIGALAILLTALTAWFLKSIVLYITISIILSLIGQPLVRLFSKIKIRRFRFPSSVNALLALITMILLLAAFFSLFIPLLVEEARIVSKINPLDVVAAFQEPLKNLEQFLQKYQISMGDGEPIEKIIASKLTSVFGFHEISNYARQIIGVTGSIIAAFFSISFITFFLMEDEHLIYNIVLLLTPAKLTEKVKEIMSDSKRLLTRYFIGILLDMAFVAACTSIGLSIFGLKNAMLIGLFAGILNVIPYIGPLLGAGFAILIGVSCNLNLDFYTQLIPLIGKIAMTFLAVQLLDALFFQPLVISKTVKAHPLEIFLVILTAGTAAGIGAMVIAVPVYTIIRIFAKEFLNNFKIVQKLTADLEDPSKKNI